MTDEKLTQEQADEKVTQKESRNHYKSIQFCQTSAQRCTQTFWRTLYITSYSSGKNCMLRNWSWFYLNMRRITARCGRRH